MKEKEFKEAFDNLFGPLVEKKVNEVLSIKTENQPPQMENPLQFLSVYKAAKEFGCSSSLLQRAMNSLELEFFQSEGRTYVRRIDVFNYLESIKIKNKANVNDYSFFKK
jgi:AraC-like DNA-binding protein